VYIPICLTPLFSLPQLLWEDALRLATTNAEVGAVSAARVRKAVTADDLSAAKTFAGSDPQLKIILTGGIGGKELERGLERDGFIRTQEWDAARALCATKEEEAFVSQAKEAAEAQPEKGGQKGWCFNWAVG